MFRTSKFYCPSPVPSRPSPVQVQVQVQSQHCPWVCGVPLSSYKSLDIHPYS